MSESSSNRAKGILIGLIAAVAVLAGGFAWMGRSSGPTQDASPYPPAATQAEEQAVVPSDTEPAATEAEAGLGAEDLEVEAAETEVAAVAAVEAIEEAALPVDIPEAQVVGRDNIRFTGEQIVATVNGVTIDGKDLSPFSPDRLDAERSMSPEMYEDRLAKAITRELTMQAARSEGVELTEANLEQIERLRASRQHDDAVVDPIGDQDAIIEFEAKQAEAHLLEKSLLEKQGVAPPYVDEGLVQAYYEDNMADYGALPDDPAERVTAWQKIALKIRKDLAPIVQADYQGEREAYLDGLEAEADIEILLEPEAI